MEFERKAPTSSLPVHSVVHSINSNTIEASSSTYICANNNYPNDSHWLHSSALNVVHVVYL